MLSISLPCRLQSSALILLIPVFLIAIMFVMVWTSHTAYAQAVVAPSCPQGFVLSGAQCVASTPAPSCPNGYKFSNGGCVAANFAPRPPPRNVPRSTPRSANTAGPWVFIVNISLGVQSARDLDGAAVCLVTGSASELATQEFFRNNAISYEAVLGNTTEDALNSYAVSACDTVVVEDRLGNQSIDSMSRPGDHGILPERLRASAATSSPPNRRAAPIRRNANQRPVDLATPLQGELKRIGCLTGRVDGIWGRGSRAALNRFSKQAGLRLGSEPTQNALTEARKKRARFCPPVRANNANSNRCRSGSVFLEGQCIRKSEVAEYCGPGYEQSGSKCVQMGSDADLPAEKIYRCNRKDRAFCKPIAQEYCEGDSSNSCINQEMKVCLRDEIGCKP